MLGVRKLTITVFILGLLLGTMLGARLQTHADITRWPPTWGADSSGAAGGDMGGHVVFSASGGGTGERKADTDTFRASGPFTVVWSTTGAGLTSSGLITIILGGGAMDAVGSGVAFPSTFPQGSTVERHANCSAGCYFTVNTSNLRYGLKVMQ